MWVIVSYDIVNQKECIIDVVETFPNLINYFQVLESMSSNFKLIAPIPASSTEGKLIPVATTDTSDYYIIRKTPTDSPIKKLKTELNNEKVQILYSIICRKC